jgi:hypothetical protein
MVQLPTRPGAMFFRSPEPAMARPSLDYPNAALLATRYARRPLLLTPMAAEELAHRVRALDDRAFSRPGRLDAFLRRVGLAKAGADANPVRTRPSAMEDDDYGPPPPPLEERLAYTPLWLGEPEDTRLLLDPEGRRRADVRRHAPGRRGEEFCGVVYHGYDTLLAGHARGHGRQRVQGVFLRLSSPGGVVAGGLPALAAFMREAARRRPAASRSTSMPTWPAAPPTGSPPRPTGSRRRAWSAWSARSARCWCTRTGRAR